MPKESVNGVHGPRERVSLSYALEDQQSVEQLPLEQSDQYLRPWSCMNASQQISSRGTIHGLGEGLGKVDIG